MANEAVLINKQEEPIDFIVEDATSVEKGTIMTLSGARTAKASIATDNGVILAGIARREHISGSGRTRLSIFRKGIFDITNSTTALLAGQPVVISGANTIRTATGPETQSGSKVLGVTLEDAAANEVVQVAVNL